MEHERALKEQADAETLKLIQEMENQDKEELDKQREQNANESLRLI
jgi:hypothetical protein